MSHPLMCWDIYLDALNRRAELSKDLSSIKKLMIKNEWGASTTFIDNALIWQNTVIIVTDFNANVVFATENIIEMTGYQAIEVIGKKPTMFQGEKTEFAEKEKIKNSIIQEMPFETLITNYKKDGDTYKCHIQGFPMFNKIGKLVNFVAIEKAA